VKRFYRVAPDAAILLVILLVYLPAFHGGFIWDDDHHVTENPNVIGSWGLRGIWTSGAATYYPLTLTSFWLIHTIWGPNPLPFHVLNVLMHALCAVLLRRVLVNLNAKPAAAWLGAMIWAVHPVQVESVAWITELKNTQSGVFYLLAILFFIKWHVCETRGRSSYLLYLAGLLCAIFALLSKTSTVMLPIVLALCAWYLNRGWSWKIFQVQLPFFFMSAIAAAWTISEQKFHSGAIGDEWTQTFLERVAVAGYSVWFYLTKLIWPHPLIFVYPRWTIDPRDVLSVIPFAAVVVGLAVLWRYANPMRAVLFAALYFVVSLFPVLSFFDVYFFRYSFVGDHFQYLAAMGPLALAGVGVARAFERRKKPIELYAVSAALILVLGALTLQHARVFRDDETLWRDTIRKNPNAWLAYNNLAAIFMERNDTAAATAELEATLRLNPNHSEAHANLGNILLESGRFDEAAQHFQKALEGEPDYARIHDSLGVALMMSNRLDDGIVHMRRAVELDPFSATAREHLGIALGRQGNTHGALEQFKEAVTVNPNGINSRMRYATALLAEEHFPEAEVQFKEALRISPDLAPAHKFIGVTLFELHRREEAIHHLKEAVRLDPNDAEGRAKLAEFQAFRGK